MRPSHPERLVRFVVEVREREGSTLLTDAVMLRGAVVDMIKIEDMDAAVTIPHASTDDVLNQRENPTREVTVPAFPAHSLSVQLDRLSHYAALKRDA